MSLNVSHERKQRQYKLHFDECTDGKIRGFCEAFNIEINVFIINTVKSYLYSIEDDIEEGNYDTIGKYYDVSKLINAHLHNPSHEITEKDIIIESELPLLVSEAIEHICDEIPLTPEVFLTDIVTGEIAILINCVKEMGYDFLGKYKDYSKIIKSIQQIHEEGSI